ncbi:MAG: AI-2E family transporter [Candidatus Latescibacteria bacterium]|nr:AI-2E family transporter [Candidatus Latescibacterota bacterium]
MNDPFLWTIIIVLLIAFLCVLWAKGVLSLSLIALVLGVAVMCQRGWFSISAFLLIETIILIGVWLLNEIGGIIAPFALSFTLAYLLNPFVRRLSRWVPRGVAIAMIALAGLAGTIAGGILLIPRLSTEASGLAERLPTYRETVQQWFVSLPYGPIGEAMGDNLREQMARELPNLGQTFLQKAVAILQKAIGRATNLISQLLNLIVLPFATFYFLRDYPRLSGSLINLVPVEHREMVQTLSAASTTIIGRYLRGQAIVCLFVSGATALGLAIAGIDYAIILGVMTGLLNLVPYIGITTALIVAALVALLGTSPLSALLRVGLVFVIVQILDGNVISPKVVGEQVGLHPLWVMFAVLLFAHFWGIVGMILAIPVSAVLNVTITKVLQINERPLC